VEEKMRAFCIVLTVLLIASVALGTEKEKRFEYPLPPTSRALDCSNAIPVTCGSTYTGSNIGVASTADLYSCVGWNETGGDVVYELVIEEGTCQIITGTISGMSADLDIFFLGSCDENDCLEYGNTSFTTSCLEPGTYYIVVDGYYGASSDYVLDVVCEECSCPTPPCCPFENDCYFIDFNETDGGFVTLPCNGNPVWDWAAVSNPDVPPIACEDVAVTNILGTNVNGDYGDDAGEIAYVGPFYISEYCTCLELCHFYDTENRFDGGNVKISTDGGATWTLVAPSRLYDDVGYSSNACIPLEEVFTGHTYSTVFHQDCFDVSAFGGMDIWVGFFFGSDGSVGYYPGWYIKWLKIGSDDSTPVEESSWGHIKAMYR
jgi:hypothetical protein